MNKTSFSAFIKEEIITYNMKKSEIEDFLNGFILANSITKDETEYLKLTIKNPLIFNYVVSFLKKLKIQYQKSKITITIDDYKQDLYKISYSSPQHFFAGVFCGSGNIMDKNSTSYHLEISSHNLEALSLCINKLNEYDFNFQIIQRKNKWIAYIKKLDKIADFLAAIGAKKSYFELQDIKINRDLDNSINRINNIDFSNLTKSVKSSLNYSKMINFVLENNIEHLFSAEQLIFFDLKLNYPESSLQDLSLILSENHNIFISKSGLNHWLIKLKQVYKMYK
ncbi:DNA-binding protein WhiA [Mycoplasmopsis pullorum]|uniref:Probable cell division protein WhiA n=1 Tax=Mycoplasmopsis pullorum TaxID=48003 RepID=A0A1L4FSR4_9BACT|nr:DNA-binding protein WhiA [Mycoplasmopsis pullorum]APJ38653.1 DNA-binding protein WhiA [Mycoplasmopsis pullorum]